MPGTSTKLGLIRRGVRFLSGRDQLRPVVVQDVQIGAPPGVSTKGAKRPDTKQKPTILTYEWKQYRAGFVEPEYDLIEIFKALDTESFMRISFDKHEELILKNGWRIVSQNPSVLSYILKRLTEISWSQNEPLERIIEGGIEELVETHNTFYVMARKENGKTYTSRFGRTMYPISGIFMPSSASMRPFIITTPKGLREIKEWWQVVGGRIFRRYDPNNVVHMPFRKKKGNIFGTPYVISVLDDILALRRMEELVEILVHKHAFPFFQYKVGTDQEPAREYDDGHSEVDDVRAAISKMPFEGGFVTPHRHTIEVVGTANKFVAVDPYLKHYESRVLSGLNLSGIDIGRGETANRSTAQTMSRGLADRCTRYQLFFCSQFSFYVLDELVMEMGIAPTPENRCYLLFPTIDAEESRAMENHTMTLYQGNLLTETEARTRMGMDPIMPTQRKDMNMARVSKPLALIKAVDEPYLATYGPPEARAAAAKASAANQPENQSGKLAAKPKTAKNDAAMAIALSDWELMRHDVLHNLGGASVYVDYLRDDLGTMVDSWFSEGLERYKASAGESAKELYIGKNVKDGFFADIVDSELDGIAKVINLRLNAMESELDRSCMLDSVWPLVELFLNNLADVAAAYAYARAAQIDHKTHVQWQLTDKACEQCRAGSAPMKIRRFSWADMRRHPECVTQLVVSKPEDVRESS